MVVSLLLLFIIHCAAFREKNPTHGKQRIYWPMRIVAPIPKNPASKAKFAKKQTLISAEILHPLWTNVFKSQITTFYYFSPRKKLVKKNFAAAILHPLQAEALLFPKDSKILKRLDNGIWEVGTKRPLNGVKNTDSKKIMLSKAKFTQKIIFCAAILHPLLVKVFQSQTISFHYFSPRIRNL